MSAGELILPAETFDDVRRQVVGVARHRDALRAAGQHLKRGLLLYGPPGVGKTHTVRYLVGELTDTTIVQLSGDALSAIKQACSIARSLQPAMIVVEDVDLIAQQRDMYEGGAPLLFMLLNEMDGLEEDADVVFLLTTNRADLLEDALASRPGRVDQAVHIDLPDREARRRLVELYRREPGPRRVPPGRRCSTGPTASRRRSSRSCCGGPRWSRPTASGGERGARVGRRPGHRPRRPARHAQPDDPPRRSACRGRSVPGPHVRCWRTGPDSPGSGGLRRLGSQRDWQ